MVMTKAKAGSKKAKAKADREVIYQDLREVRYVGDTALTPDDAKKMLGWTTNEDDAKEAGIKEHTLKDREGNPVWQLNNDINRPLVMGRVEDLLQAIRTRKWRYNGEAIAIGKTGRIINGQKQLTALVLAGYDQANAKSDEEIEEWASYWGDTPVSIDKLVVYGVDESDDVANTYDLAQSRSLSDIIYRSEYFSKMDAKDRKTIARTTEHAIRMLWSRTGGGGVAFQGTQARRKTHTELLDFLSRHPRLLRCVKHIQNENPENAIGQFISPGYAAAFMYLMASSGTNPDAYHTATPPREGGEGKKAIVQFSLWDEAAEFWVLLGSGSPDFTEVRKALRALNDIDLGAAGGLSQKIAVLCQAWKAFSSGVRKVSLKHLALAYGVNEVGDTVLEENYTFGGIDVGKPPKQKKKDPTEEEIKEGTKKIREERDGSSRDKRANAGGEVASAVDEDGFGEEFAGEFGSEDSDE